MSDSGSVEIVSWTPVLERFFAEAAETAEGLSWLHSRSEMLYNYRRTFVDIPVIVGSGVIGFLSAGSTALFSGKTEMASIALGIGSLAVGTINTLGTYFGWSKRAEGHRIAALSNAKLSRFLRIELGLPRDERMTPGGLLKLTKTEIDRLQETSPSIPLQIRGEFKARFRDVTDIAKPSEVNGLHKVEIYGGLLNQTAALDLPAGARLRPAGLTAPPQSPMPDMSVVSPLPSSFQNPVLVVRQPAQPVELYKSSPIDETHDSFSSTSSPPPKMRDL